MVMSVWCWKFSSSSAAVLVPIAMGSSDGQHGIDVKDLEHPIEVPVGKTNCRAVYRTYWVNQ
ncbi:hypothetical protein ACLK18_21270 [Escherichia coli]